MGKIDPKLFVHCSYIGTTGYNNHTRSFLRALSNLIDIKVRNFTVCSWEGMNDEPHNKEPYLDSLDKKLLNQQTLFASATNHNDFVTHDFYKKYPNEFDHNVDLVLSELNHHYYFDHYPNIKIAFIVWETTRYPDRLFENFKNFDQIWVASTWQKECLMEQGMPEDMVKVIPEAVDNSLFKPKNYYSPRI